MTPKEPNASQETPPLTQLGHEVSTPENPDAAVLERVPNIHSDTPFVARFACPEFTALCSVTGQPDFAHLVIDYVPDKWLLESKSLKLYLHAHRNYRSFHEACTVGIGKRLMRALEPHYLRIGAYWYPRGGIPIDVFFQSGSLPDGVWLPDQGIQPYRGRG
jgi:7-cyano-7-deazaguanine reductase